MSEREGRVATIRSSSELSELVSLLFTELLDIELFGLDPEFKVGDPLVLF